MSAGTELDDQSSQVCSPLELVESAGLLELVLVDVVEVILIGVLEPVVLSAGVELEDQSSQVCSSLELELEVELVESDLLLVVVVILTGEEVVEVVELVIFTGEEVELVVVLIEEVVVELVVLVILIGVLELFVVSAGTEDEDVLEESPALDQSAQSERACRCLCTFSTCAPADTVDPSSAAPAATMVTALILT